MTTYYLTKTRGLVELRQQRFRKAFEKGHEHPHDVCAIASSKNEMRDMVIRNRLGPVEWDTIPDEAQP